MLIVIYVHDNTTVCRATRYWTPCGVRLPVYLLAELLSITHLGHSESQPFGIKVDINHKSCLATFVAWGQCIRLWSCINVLFNSYTRLLSSKVDISALDSGWYDIDSYHQMSRKWFEYKSRTRSSIAHGCRQWNRGRRVGDYGRT